MQMCAQTRNICRLEAALWVYGKVVLVHFSGVVKALLFVALAQRFVHGAAEKIYFFTGGNVIEFSETISHGFTRIQGFIWNHSRKKEKQTGRGDSFSKWPRTLAFWAMHFRFQ